MRRFALRSIPRRTNLPAANPTLSRFFSASSPQWALGEHESDQPNRSKKVKEHRDDSVGKAKSGEGEWKPELASQTEENVKADKHDMSMEEMQKVGSKKAEEGKQPAGSDKSKDT